MELIIGHIPWCGYFYGSIPENIKNSDYPNRLGFGYSVLSTFCIL
jgi:hypothetical protein